MIRGYKYSKEEFLVIVAKKKPAIQAILDNLDSYTVDQLKNISDQPLWVREALVGLKEKTRKDLEDAEARKRAETIADQMEKASPQQSLYYDENHEFFVRRWVSDDRYLKVHTSMRLDILVNYGDPILLMAEYGKIRIGDTVYNLPSTEWPMLIQNSEPMGKYTRLSYHEMYQDHLSKKYS